MSHQQARAARFLDQAIQLAAANARSGAGGPFGAVLARGDEVISTGVNRVTTGNDPTAHAEIVALREACRRLGVYELGGCSLYSSCEPCPMCLGAVYWARVDALYFASSRHQAAEAGFDDARIYAELELPLDRRSLPTMRLERPGQGAEFLAWKRLGDRIPY
jgi:guanine deaminase